MEEEKILVWVCDDKEQIQESVRKRLIEWKPKKDDIELDLHFWKSGKEMLQQAEKGECCDILIQDIDMPEMSGLEAAEELQQRGQFDGKIIFLTSHEEYVFKAYHVNAFRYIRKEFMDLELEEAYQSAWDIIRRKKCGKPLVFKQKEETTIVRQQKVLYYDYQKRRVNFYMVDGNIIEVKIGIKSVYERCDKEKFSWLSSGVVVNVEHISELKNDRVILNNGIELFYSRTRKKELQQAFMSYVGNQI